MRKFGYLYLLLFLSGMLLLGGTITVKTPNGGEEWELDSKKNIEWAASGVLKKVKIQLFRNGQLLGLIQKDLDAQLGKFEWAVGAYSSLMATPGTGYTVRVRTMGSTDVVMDVSDNSFKIVPGSTKPEIDVNVLKQVAAKIKITISNPTKSSRWKTGQTRNIEWQSIFKGLHKVQLYNFNGKKFLRDIGVSTTGKLVWNIPHDVYKWPGNYTIRVATADDKHSGISDMFHISTQPVTTKYTVPGTTVNKFKYHNKKYGHWWYPERRPNHPDPGPGRMRVGYHYYKDDDICSTYIYRSFVFFDLASLKDKGLLLKASIKYSHFMGGNCPLRLYALDQKWNGDPEQLFTVGLSHIPDANDVTMYVRDWYNDPSVNYGVVFVGPDEVMICTIKKCVGYYQNVKLELEFLSQAK